MKIFKKFFIFLLFNFNIYNIYTLNNISSYGVSIGRDLSNPMSTYLLNIILSSIVDINIEREDKTSYSILAIYTRGMIILSPKLLYNFSKVDKIWFYAQDQKILIYNFQVFDSSNQFIKLFYFSIFNNTDLTKFGEFYSTSYPITQIMKNNGEENVIYRGTEFDNLFSPIIGSKFSILPKSDLASHSTKFTISDLKSSSFNGIDFFLIGKINVHSTSNSDINHEVITYISLKNILLNNKLYYFSDGHKSCIVGIVKNDIFTSGDLGSFLVSCKQSLCKIIGQIIEIKSYPVDSDIAMKTFGSTIGETHSQIVTSILISTMSSENLAARNSMNASNFSVEVTPSETKIIYSPSHILTNKYVPVKSKDPHMVDIQTPLQKSTSATQGVINPAINSGQVKKSEPSLILDEKEPISQVKSIAKLDSHSPSPNNDKLSYDITTQDNHLKTVVSTIKEKPSIRVNPLPKITSTDTPSDLKFQSSVPSTVKITNREQDQILLGAKKSEPNESSKIGEYKVQIDLQKIHFSKESGLGISDNDKRKRKRINDKSQEFSNPSSAKKSKPNESSEIGENKEQIDLPERPISKRSGLGISDNSKRKRKGIDDNSQEFIKPQPTKFIRESIGIDTAIQHISSERVEQVYDIEFRKLLDDCYSTLDLVGISAEANIKNKFKKEYKQDIQDDVEKEVDLDYFNYMAAESTTELTKRENIKEEDTLKQNPKLIKKRQRIKLNVLGMKGVYDFYVLEKNDLFMDVLLFNTDGHSFLSLKCVRKVVKPVFETSIRESDSTATNTLFKSKLNSSTFIKEGNLNEGVYLTTDNKYFQVIKNNDSLKITELELKHKLDMEDDEDKAEFTENYFESLFNNYTRVKDIVKQQNRMSSQIALTDDTIGSNVSNGSSFYRKYMSKTPFFRNKTLKDGVYNISVKGYNYYQVINNKRRKLILRDDSNKDLEDYAYDYEISDDIYKQIFKNYKINNTLIKDIKESDEKQTGDISSPSEVEQREKDSDKEHETYINEWEYQISSRGSVKFELVQVIEKVRRRGVPTVRKINNVTISKNKYEDLTEIYPLKDIIPSINDFIKYYK